MLPPKNTAPPDQQRLLRLFRQLGETERRSLLDFAEFLAGRGPSGRPASASPDAPLEMPAEIPRPDSESVVAAIRRLSQTFHMLDKDELLHEASGLMTEHVMQGKPAAEVIDELELTFRRHYERVKSGSD